MQYELHYYVEKDLYVCKVAVKIDGRIKIYSREEIIQIVKGGTKVKGLSIDKSGALVIDTAYLHKKKYAPPKREEIIVELIRSKKPKEAVKSRSVIDPIIEIDPRSEAELIIDEKLKDKNERKLKYERILSKEDDIFARRNIREMIRSISMDIENLNLDMEKARQAREEEERAKKEKANPPKIHKNEIKRCINILNKAPENIKISQELIHKLKTEIEELNRKLLVSTYYARESTKKQIESKTKQIEKVTKLLDSDTQMLAYARKTLTEHGIEVN